MPHNKPFFCYFDTTIYFLLDMIYENGYKLNAYVQNATYNKKCVFHRLWIHCYQTYAVCQFGPE